MMKKKIIATICASALLMASITGCAGSTGIDTDELKVTKYKGVEVDKIDDAAEVTDEQVEAYIDNKLEEKKTTKEITDRAVEDGDTVKIDYEGKKDGVAFDGGTATDADLTIGSGTFIDGFEDSVIGHKIGETFDWNGKFPDDYGNTELAGQDVVFTITVKGITESEVPELTDKLAKELSTKKSKTIKEYKEEVKEILTQQAQWTYENSLASAVWEKILENSEVKKYDQEAVDKSVDEQIASLKSMAEQQGMSMEDVVTQYGFETEDELRKTVETNVKDSEKSNMVLKAIAEKEKLEPTGDKLEEYYQKIADMNNIGTIDELKELADEDTLKEMSLQLAVNDWLAKNCVQVEK
ncbi:trigger factor [Ohessyouella blattaphilus]|uniref:peptidylprolyl isomerase n=1 Tax=Ohessyouella blattaphilus TaxID=2949333 RepID=A0ABT1EHV9_9FIRM|nr:trigger factor [Ohessyouella blattaphilus]MCP1110288.1 trigger factor [Ohessyouella blattaphilus]MCR8563682.1 trigger factor [Ohessyouella blattaphilus]